MLFVTNNIWFYKSFSNILFLLPPLPYFLLPPLPHILLLLLLILLLLLLPLFFLLFCHLLLQGKPKFLQPTNKLDLGYLATSYPDISIIWP